MDKKKTILKKQEIKVGEDMGKTRVRDTVSADIRGKLPMILLYFHPRWRGSGLRVSRSSNRKPPVSTKSELHPEVWMISYQGSSVQTRQGEGSVERNRDIDQ